mmetsp:Transcript_11168/g.19085  ORF Transcript_11168/g.19085 Transcript_11168/m.19085 type:complete len:1016 (-) Transcript_11168:33-3080(-)
MAYLQPPLTIISSDNNDHAKLSSSTTSARHQHSKSSVESFRLPAATWFDEDQTHFVALEERIADPYESRRTSFTSGSLISGFESLITNTTDPDEEESSAEFEVVRYQAFGLPRQNISKVNSNSSSEQRYHPFEDYNILDGGDDMSDDNSQEDLDTSHKTNNLSAFESAAKKAAKEHKNKSLVTEIAVSFQLPSSLANVENREEQSTSGNTDDNTTTDDDTTVMLARRIPILAKFSPMVNGVRYLALQYTPTMIRIAAVEGGQHHNTDKHWTIDISLDPNPIASSPKGLANFDLGSSMTFFNKSRDKENEGIITGTTTIIGGGIIWCKRANNVLDLIVVTTTSVLLYSINNEQMTKTQVVVLEHPSASFWYEPQSKTLVVGSYTSNLPRNLSESISEGMISSENMGRGNASSPTVSFPIAVMSMKTLFFRGDSPTFQTLPTFAVGTLREKTVEDKGKTPSPQARDGSDNVTSDDRSNVEENIIFPTEVSLFNFYGSIYCVEIGSLGNGHGIGLTELDNDSSCIRVRQHKIENLPMNSESVSVGAIDNLLCIISRENKVTHFIDVADIFSDDRRVPHESIKVSELAEGDVSIYDEKISFLAPSYFLNTEDQGLLYQVGISLPLVVKSAPPTACIIPFLLRRKSSKDTIRSFVMERFSAAIEARDLSSLRQWLGVITKQYASNARAAKWDYESTISLLSKSSLVGLDRTADVNTASTVGEVMLPDSSCVETVTQTEMLQMILLPHAMAAVNDRNSEKLRFVSTLSVHYLIELERLFLIPCVALEMLVITLLLKAGEQDELASFLSARETQRTITRRRRQLDLPTNNRLYSENPGAAAFAETLFLIATNSETEPPSSIKKQLISLATVILIECGSTSVAVKCLLTADQISEAIALCSKRSKANKDTAEAKSMGSQAKDFFRVAAKTAKGQKESDRCKSFYHLHCFLKQYDPTCFSLDKRKVKVSRMEDKNKSAFRKDISTVIVEQSVLAHEIRFPDELFSSPQYCRKFRSMFGYAESVK